MSKGYVQMNICPKCNKVVAYVQMNICPKCNKVVKSDVTSVY